MPLTFFSLPSPPPSSPSSSLLGTTICSIVTPPSARHHALLVPLSVCPSLYSIVALSAVAIAVGASPNHHHQASSTAPPALSYPAPLQLPRR
ncbi:hypothetical protein Scep_019249 [Stephania cephalantha]|uniref:Uncharacterized protein n=1 Tax=Stephania cephalantha TaxID=152367 RepID=A0AAP0NN31_9MAGN